MSLPPDERREHFAVHGWMRVRAAFTASDAAAMRAVVWRALEAAGIRASERAGRVRLAFHVYTTVEDVNAAVAALR